MIAKIGTSVCLTHRFWGRVYFRVASADRPPRPASGGSAPALRALFGRLSGCVFGAVVIKMPNQDEAVGDGVEDLGWEAAGGGVGLFLLLMLMLMLA